jgi:hypothetical protein
MLRHMCTKPRWGGCRYLHKPKAVVQGAVAGARGSARRKGCLAAGQSVAAAVPARETRLALTVYLPYPRTPTTARVLRPHKAGAKGGAQ